MQAVPSDAAVGFHVPPSPSGLPGRAHPRLRAVVALGAAAVGLSALALAGAPGLRVLATAPSVLSPAATWPALLAFAALLFLLQQQGFVFRWRGQSTKISLDEGAFFLGVLVLPLPHVVLATTASAVVNQWIHRRAPYKAAFNVGEYAASAFAAAGAALALRLAGVPEPWLALPAPFVFSGSTNLLVSALFSRVERTSTWRVFHDRFSRFVVVGGFLGTSLGLVVVALYALHPLAVLAAIPVFLYLRRFGRLSEWADDELKTHQLLASVSAQVAGSGDLVAVAQRIFHACHELFDCGEAHLTLAGADGGPPRFWRASFGDGAAGASGVTASVLDGQGGCIGTLSVFPKPGQSGYGEREHHLLRAVAANVAAAAANARALRAAEEAYGELRASETRYRNLFETGHVLVHVLDAEGRVLDANPAATGSLGHADGELRGRHLGDLLHDPDAAEELLARLREERDVRGVETTLRAKDGRAVHVLLDARLEEDVQGSEGIVLCSRDITPLKALEQELRRSMAEQRETIRRLENMNRELEEFTLWTTHDMREPLRSIGTIATFLHEDIGHIDAEEARDMAARISSGAERLKERVKALHAFSRIVQRDDAFEDVDLQQVVEAVVAGLETRLQEKDASVRLPERPLPVVRAQRHRIDLVFANLLENALKYGAGHGSVVRVEAEQRDDEWRFSVADDGPGIPPGYHERIFHLFQRGPQTEEPGSGAGLAIVKRVVEQHGGRAWVESPPDGGARFTFTLPRVVARSAPDALAAAAAAVSGAEGGAGRTEAVAARKRF